MFRRVRSGVFSTRPSPNVHGEYEGTQTDIRVDVLMKDAGNVVREAASETLARAVPQELPVNLAAMREAGLDLKHVTEMTLKIRGNGKAGRLLVSGLVNPRPALVERR